MISPFLDLIIRYTFFEREGGKKAHWELAFFREKGDFVFNIRFYHWLCSHSLCVWELRN